MFVVLTYEGKTDRLVCCGGGGVVMLMGRLTTTMPALENREEINLLPTTCTYLLALAPANKPREWNPTFHYFLYDILEQVQVRACDSEVEKEKSSIYVVCVVDGWGKLVWCTNAHEGKDSELK